MAQADETERLRRRYRGLGAAELLEIAHSTPAEYRPQAIALAREELLHRDASEIETALPEVRARRIERSHAEAESANAPLQAGRWVAGLLIALGLMGVINNTFLAGSTLCIAPRGSGCEAAQAVPFGAGLACLVVGVVLYRYTSRGV